jgi:isocitrate dehydrogenase
MKQTDGLFHQIFDEIATEYPNIENEHWIIDIGAAKMSDTPEAFDVIVTLNLYGDVLSDIAAQIAGSVGLAGSANIGEECAMFEAIHGSAPRRAGQNMANPSGLLQGAVMMLNHLGQNDVATKVQNAWLKTLEDGIHTYDIYDETKSKQLVGTIEFANAIINNLGQKPAELKAVNYQNGQALVLPKYQKKKPAKKELIGHDIFVHWNGTDANELASKLASIKTQNLKLNMITNRGIKVWPDGFSQTFCTDHWRCRFKTENEKSISKDEIISLLQQCNQTNIDTIKTENLYQFDGKIAFSLGQGQ